MHRGRMLWGMYLYEHPRILDRCFLPDLIHNRRLWVAGGEGGEVGCAEGIHFGLTEIGTRKRLQCEGSDSVNARA